MNKRSGFTLIELLLVISIIALLMATLMPTLNRVKKQASAAACLSNLHQWSLFFSMYAHDNDNCFPQGNRGLKNGGNNRWVKALEVFFGLINNSIKGHRFFDFDARGGLSVLR